MPTICTGHALRVERRRIEMPQVALAALCGTQVSAISAAENRPGLLPDSLRSRVEDTLARVERMRLALLPAKLDLSDSAALREALAAFERGDFASLTERVKQPENPPLIRF